MLKHTTVLKAAMFAAKAHDGQVRKYTLTPYIGHPAKVAAIVATVTDDPEMLAAAWLHDVVEDTPVTVEDIRKEFGPRVAALVDDLTDVSRPSDGNRAARKALDLAHSAAASADAHTIKLADLIDNSRSITAHDPHFAVVYMREKRALLGVLTKGHADLRARAAAILADWEKNRKH